MSTFHDHVLSQIDELDIDYRREIRFGRWKADVVIDMPERNCLIMEIREKGTIPSVLMVASILFWFRRNGNPNYDTIGALCLKEHPNKSVISVAKQNDVEIITFGDKKGEAKEKILALTNNARKRTR